jgi:predicted phosphodiesterase
MVRGNADNFETDRLDHYKNLIFSGRIGRIELDGQWIGLCHEPFLFDQVIAEGACSIVFYGHTHKPWEEEKKETRFANPGTLAGMFQMATFAIYDTASGELVLQILDRL